MSPQETATAQSEIRSNAAAILVIHGIGEQNPYETLDSFARGLAEQFKVPAGTMEHRLRLRPGRRGSEGRTETCVRIPLGKGTGRESVSTLDVYEFYWAGLVEGQIGIRQVLGWIFRTSLTPLNNLSRPEVFFRGIQANRLPAVLVFLREMWRAIWMLGLAGLLIFGFAYPAVRYQNVTGSIGAITDALGSITHPVVVSLWAVSVLLSTVLLGSVIKLSIGNSVPVSAEHRAVRSGWRWIAIGALVVLSGIALALPRLLDFHPITGTAALLREDEHLKPSIVAISALLLACALRWALVKFVGDVAIYVAADEKSSFYRTRTRILDQACERVNALLDDKGYSAVYIAGHSLGSVIAYDLLNRLSREVRAVTADRTAQEAQQARSRFDRILGLLTFGSPLNKTYYLFKTEVAEKQSIRAQILSSLHGVRKLPSGSDYGGLKLRPYVIPVPRRLRWVNVAGLMDPVGARLRYYEVEVNQLLTSRRYWNPLTAHTNYWDDPDFHKLVVDWL